MALPSNANKVFSGVLVDVFQWPQKRYDGSSRFKEHLFVAKNCKKVARPNPDPGEKISLKLMTLDEVLQLNRKRDFRIPAPLRLMLYECLVDKKKREELEKKIFG